MKLPLPVYLLLLLHLLLCTGALYGGWSLMFDPNALGLNPAWLEKTPFKSYQIPGLILFIFNGIFPLLIIAGLWKRPDWQWANVLNIYRDRHWAWTYSLFSGIILIIWITVQITMVPFFWLQPAFLTVGILLLVLTLWPSTMRFYQIS